MKNIFPKVQLLKTPHLISCGRVVDVFRVFTLIEQNSNHCFLFESLGQYGDAERYSVLGFDPIYVISAKGNTISCNGQSMVVDNPYDYLRTIMPPHIASFQHFVGGLVGNLAYDAVSYFEPSLQVKIHPTYDQFSFGMYSDGLFYDKVTRELTYFYHTQNRLDLVQNMLRRSVKKLSLTVDCLGDSLTQAQHAQGVSQIKQEIRAGNTFQSQFGFKRTYSFLGDHVAVYKKLRTINPSPYMFYIKNADTTIMGASPELLFRLRGGAMATFPLAGTTGRDKDKTEDLRLAQGLLQDPKEIAEHNMLVDLHRNDLGKVAVFGSVRVARLKEIKQFSHVQHISSEIVGTLKDSEDMFSALASNFPAGTLSGAPKIESMRIIDRTESEARGPYGGAVGYYGFDGNCSFFIPIRSLFISHNQGYIQASGGIVYDSNPAQEYREIQRKLAALDAVLTSFVVKGDEI